MYSSWLRQSSRGIIASSRWSVLSKANLSSAASSSKTFDKILIANRGEIACRVIRTAKRLGVKTVAVYSDADARSQHVLQADEAYNIGAPPASESYLLKDKIIEVAKRSGAQAIHPGYGFLSENSDFATACEKAGIEFIGPPKEAIIAMGSKSASKDIMIAAGVPVTPGYHEENQDIDVMQRAADKMGYPLIVKAVMGGGGKGMRIVYSSEEFREAVESCQREAKSSFGNTRVLFEKFLTKPRHIEFQVFADKFGNTVHLFERDCSVQRRHQKVLEEAPAPHMSADLRKKMGDAAVAAAKAVGYVGAGTVEFMLDEDESFYFMEMNTRLQVEHPVTEMITRQDLVEWQLKVAAGHKLPLTQEEIKMYGHSIEARIYAENPYKDFLPGTGKLAHVRLPPSSPDVRVETGVVTGDEVSIFYDPMIAKLVVWGSDREEALKRMKSSLEQYQIVGLTTNIEFLGRTVKHPTFVSGAVTTNFLDFEGDPLTVPLGPAPPSGYALAALTLLLQEQQSMLSDAKLSKDPRSPWATPQLSGFRPNHNLARSLTFIDGEIDVQVSVEPKSDGSYSITAPNSQPLKVTGTLTSDGQLEARVGNHKYTANTVIYNNTLHLFATDDELRYVYQLGLPKPTFESAAGGSGKPTLQSPMPGKIVKLMVAAGQKIKKDQAVIIMEAMKMEHIIRAPKDGVVAELFCVEGGQVEAGRVLVELK